MRKLLLFAFVVLVPAVIVGISNFEVFPDSALPATLMLVVTVGVAAVFTWQSGDATPKIARYCICADFVIAAILCVNLGSHWLLSREVSAAKQGVVERHTEEDRDDRRAKERAERELALRRADMDVARAEAELADKQAKLQREERRRLAQLPLSERRSILAAPKQETKPAPTIQPMSLLPDGAAAVAVAVPVAATAPVVAPKLRPEQVRDSWWWKLTALAFAECFASVLAGAILAGIWEWDKNKNGVPDHLERPAGAGAQPGK
jgi:hypothetical protein